MDSIFVNAHRLPVRLAAALRDGRWNAMAPQSLEWMGVETGVQRVHRIDKIVVERPYTQLRITPRDLLPEQSMASETAALARLAADPAYSPIYGVVPTRSESSSPSFLSMESIVAIIVTHAEDNVCLEYLPNGRVRVMSNFSPTGPRPRTCGQWQELCSSFDVFAERCGL